MKKAFSRIYTAEDAPSNLSEETLDLDNSASPVLLLLPFLSFCFSFCFYYYLIEYNFNSSVTKLLLIPMTV